MVKNETQDSLSLEERPIPEPGKGEVRIKVHACGVRFSDHFVIGGVWPGLEFPRVPGHEVAGTVDAVGKGVDFFNTGDRVGLGWHGGHDGHCEPCQQGHFIHCRQAQITGISFDGGYSEYVIAPAIAIARVPDGMDFIDAAPLLCAGVTTFNALRHSTARPGDVVGIQGLGGLGHLGVQYAKAMGFKTVAISRGADKKAHAVELGADHYIDSENDNFAETMQALGGAKVILATAPNAKAISSLLTGLGIKGRVIVLGAPFEPLEVGAIDLITWDRGIEGWSSGTAADSNDAMLFAQQHGIRPMVETFPLQEAQAAFEKMMAGELRFRAVLTTA